MKVLKEKIERQLTLKSHSVTDEDLEKINEYALEPLTADEIYAFKVVMGDNELDDRNNMPFTSNGLKDLQRLYPGKPFIMAHNDRDVKSLFARIYDTELSIDDTKRTSAEEPYTALIGKCYMAISADNESLRADIKAGIKKEVSTGFRCSSLKCSICGKDNCVDECKHWPGRVYAKNGMDTKCQMLIDGCSEAYELSLVTIPAQPRAGTIKSAEGAPEDPEAETSAHDSEKLRLELELLSL
ncbi:MAG: hypothetical protein IJ555_03075 [Ruminococcus sp.]|nr:hypothetical protein [Ruminococcus sp.]